MTNMIETDNLIKEGKWTEFLNSIPLDRPKGYIFPSTKAMDSCKSVAYRMNVTESDRQFKLNMDYRHLMITITAQIR